MVGYLVFVSLSAVALVAALAVVSRARFSGRAEALLATLVGASFLVLLPLYVLAHLSLLTRANLAGSSLVTSSAALAASFFRTPARQHTRAVAALGAHVAGLPAAAFREAYASRSLAFFGLFVVALVLGWSGLTTYLAPSWRTWDCLWYHEPIVGFTLQNRGFAMVELPSTLEKINGYPKVAEMLSLWCVVFTDRRLIELPSVLYVVPLMLATYVVARRFSTNRVVPLDLAVVVVCMPCVWQQLQSTLVDVPSAAFSAAALHFATRPVLRLRDGATASVALALALGTKVLALLTVPLIGLVAAVRIVAAHRRRPRALALVVGFGVLLLLAVAASTYLRNWLHFRNPFWPDLRYESAALGIHWDGPHPWIETVPDAKSFNLPADQFLDILFGPARDAGGDRALKYNYGHAVPWAVLPLAVAGALAAGLVLLRALGQRFVFGDALDPRARRAANAMTVLACVAGHAFSPAVWSARYQIVVVVAFGAFAAWSEGQTRIGAFARHLAEAGVLLSLVLFGWQWADELERQPAVAEAVPKGRDGEGVGDGSSARRHFYGWSLVRAMMGMPYPAREVEPLFGAASARRAGRAREADLGAGSLVAFTEDYGAYLGLLWNNDFSNRVQYFAPPEALDRAWAAGAQWFLCPASETTRCAEYRGGRLRDVGPLFIESGHHVFAR